MIKDTLKNIIKDFNPDNLMFCMDVDGYGLAVYRMNTDSFTILTQNGQTLLSSIQVDVTEFDSDVDSILTEYELPQSLKDAFRLRVDEITEYLMYKVWVK